MKVIFCLNSILRKNVYKVIRLWNVAFCDGKFLQKIALVGEQYTSEVEYDL